MRSRRCAPPPSSGTHNIRLTLPHPPVSLIPNPSVKVRANPSPLTVSQLIVVFYPPTPLLHAGWRTHPSLPVVSTGSWIASPDRHQQLIHFVALYLHSCQDITKISSLLVPRPPSPPSLIRTLGSIFFQSDFAGRAGTGVCNLVVDIICILRIHALYGGSRKGE